MKKQIVFNEKDKELIGKIKKYQEENDIKFFIDAVRQLCRNGLSHSVNVKIDLN